MTFYTAKEIAEILKISYENALDIIKYSGIPYVRIGRQYRVSVSSFNRFFSRDAPIEIDVTANF